MFSLNVDLGQVIIATLIAVLGYFFKKTIDDFSKRLDKHDALIYNLSMAVSQLLGAMFPGRSVKFGSDDAPTK